MSLLMELVFRGSPPEFLCIYLDNVLLATPTVETHLVLLEKVFAALKQAGLKVHPGKCLLAQNRIRTLGFLLDAEGIHPDPVNLAKIEEWPVPVDVKQIQQYLGLTSYFTGKFISTAIRKLLITF